MVAQTALPQAIPERAPEPTTTASGRTQEAGDAGFVQAVATLTGLVADATAIDGGTRLFRYADFRALIEGTHLQDLKVEGGVEPVIAPTRMQRIRDWAPLSLRDWAPVFGVSHSAIRQWEDDDPDREELSQVLTLLEEARPFHSNLAVWLTEPLAGMNIKPLDLLRDQRWRAFRGAIRSRPAPAVTLTADQLRQRRRDEPTWAVPEPAVTLEPE